MTDFISLPNQENKDSQAFKKFFLRVRSNWYWILGALLFFCTIGYIFLRYSVPVFRVKTTLLIKDSGGFQDPSEILFDDISFQNKEKVFNESAIVTSHPLVFESIRQLGFWVTFYSKGTVNNVELYSDNPFELVVDTARVFSSDPTLPYGVEFKVSLIDNNHFQLIAQSDGSELIPPFSVNKKCQYNQVVKVGNFEFALRLVKPEKVVKEVIVKEYSFKIFNLRRLATEYKQKILVKPEPIGSTILDISIQHSVPKKAIDFLNKLIENYANQNLALKNEVSIRTINFIDNELSHTSDTLGSVEAQLERFKSSYQIADIGAEAKMLMEELNKLDNERAKYIVARKYYEYLKNNSSSEDFNNAVFPFSLGENQDPVLNKLVMDLISLQLEKKVYIDQGMVQSPQVKLIEDRIKTLRGKILENVTNLIKANELAMNDLDDRIRQVERSIKQLPRSERELVNIQRNYKLSENLYVFLMEKRTEAAISRSSNTPDIQIVEPAMLSPDIPIFPKPILIYALMVFLGTTLPIGVILIKHFAQNKIISKSEITQKTSIPFLGVVPHNTGGGKKYKLVAFEKPRGSIAESFRIIRSNISYMRLGQNKNGESTIILLTSSIANEGKTFTSTNLAVTLSMTGQKTVVLGLDLRKPKIHEYLKTTNSTENSLGSLPGVAQYFSGETPIESIIYPTQADYLYAIPSGQTLPPNPSELLMGERMAQLIEYLKANFTYIVLDTPPVGLVTDAFVLAKYSDINIFVMRQNVTQIDFIDYIDEIYQNKKLNNLCILLNDVRGSYGYGSGYYSYGYGYYSDFDSHGNWFQKLKHRAKGIFYR